MIPLSNDTIIAASSPPPPTQDPTASALRNITAGQKTPMLVIFRDSSLTDASLTSSTASGVVYAAGMQLLTPEDTATNSSSASNSTTTATSTTTPSKAARARVKSRVLAKSAAAVKGGASLVKDFDQLPVSVVSISSLAALDALQADPDVLAVVPNRINRRMIAESLPLVGAPKAAAAGHAGAGCVVAVMDTGGWCGRRLKV